MKLYLDADIFLALIKDEDRFKDSAKQFLNRFRQNNELTTSTLTCLEIWFYLYKHGLKNKIFDSIRAMSSLCNIIDYDISHIENSIILADHRNLSPADSLHATLAMNFDAIVSSDKSFDRLIGLKRIDFTK